ncbi:mannose-1-phosphate guanylyltransferase [Microstroma glucosiphilum]|uniref:Mannose-1-phosphate guanylyltransferase n=1 Tax=Pseudomicrostroma glucosiphilum TaxID=1684307 RepID=A0A316U176_9BASI|nr:mannose-1-phosphate guanylyltransferase [Pseudomicrostroma glucosiphilum]PWN18251.1 mannose-1-phosphate guanylyltransferase [Pseudomicrostroma glucosiphilum]
MGSVASTLAKLPFEPMIDVYSIVPAGGSGTRLWPLSRDARPKFLLDLEGTGLSLLQSTYQRLLPLSGHEKVMIVTGRAHVDAVKAQLPGISDHNIVAEPSPKESMAAIGLAAMLFHERDPDAVIASFAADHVIATTDNVFASAVASAVAAARQSNGLVTIGIEPDEPSTAFGYIHLGKPEEIESDAETFARFGLTRISACQVQRFKEKPQVEEVKELLATGEYCWNAGMFVTRASVLLHLLQDTCPLLFSGLKKIAADWSSAHRQEVLASVWPHLPKISIDHAIAEPAATQGQMLVIKALLEWKDVGDYAALCEMAGPHLNPGDNQTPAKKVKVMGEAKLVFVQDGSGLFVTSSGRPIVALGIEDLVVVDTPDALLITLASRSQDIKSIVGVCKEAIPYLQ